MEVPPSWLERNKEELYTALHIGSSLIVQADCCVPMTRSAEDVLSRLHA